MMWNGVSQIPQKYKHEQEWLWLVIKILREANESSSRKDHLMQPFFKIKQLVIKHTEPNYFSLVH